MNTRATDQGVTLEIDTEKCLETDRVREDREIEVWVPEDRGRETLVLEMTLTVEEEEEEDKGREASAQEMIVVEEEEEDMRRGEVMLAMGVEAGKFAQRP